MPSEAHFSDSDTAAVSLKSCFTTETHSAQSNPLLFLICYCVFQKVLQAPHGPNCFTWNQTANELSFQWTRRRRARVRSGRQCHQRQCKKLKYSTFVPSVAPTGCDITPKNREKTCSICRNQELYNKCLASC